MVPQASSDEIPLQSGELDSLQEEEVHHSADLEFVEISTADEQPDLHNKISYTRLQPTEHLQLSGPVAGSGKLSVFRLALASMVAGGVQFGWALQLSLLTPYIQTLGIEHSLSSFIWLCGPITGLIVQPCVGIWSDKCKSKWGRRRPFIFTGSLMVTIIGFAADIGYLLGDTHQHCLVYKGLRPWAAGVFIFGFWLLDLANNTVQGPARALLADIAGSDQRYAANAIFSVWMAIGNILGFSTGASGQWHEWFPFLKSKACCEACANLKAAFLVAVIFLCVCTLVTLLCAHEEPYVPKEGKQTEDAASLLQRPVGEKELELAVFSKHQYLQINGHEFPAGNDGSNGNEERHRSLELEEKKEDIGNGLGAVLVNLLTGVRRLPASMKSVLLVMAFCWLSWFPFFLFDTDWMGREVYHGDPKGDSVTSAAYQKGVREGALGLLFNSIVLGIGALWIDPLCTWIGSRSVWAISNFMIFVCMAGTAIISAVAKSQTKGLQHIYVRSSWIRGAALTLFAILGLPLAITYSVPYSITAELTADTGGGQGLAMGILNLAIVVPQIVVALGAGPWDALFGGGNEPAFVLSAGFALVAGIIALIRLPQLSEHSYVPASGHGFG
ncbi:hypothetical protein O6H91_07G133600 [Diphasiastrum complanatum]|uniref:Uncharacterized protein n=1 Tax=Diphasiastrum complanatum TaxID=34168 RepID=A0ACC2DA02_DIPCM|nr:hypothetical protein O6H91_07G133600 [Diphasiastrum complanatum]